MSHEHSVERGPSTEPISQYRYDNNSSTDHLPRDSKAKLYTDNAESHATRSRDTLKITSNYSKDSVYRTSTSKRRWRGEDLDPCSQQLTPQANLYQTRGPKHVYMHQAVTINPASQNAKEALREKQRMMKKFAVR